eukprot:1925108-Amphidinium_carterae.1
MDCTSAVAVCKDVLTRSSCARQVHTDGHKSASTTYRRVLTAHSASSRIATLEQSCIRNLNAKFAAIVARSSESLGSGSCNCGCRSSRTVLETLV